MLMASCVAVPERVFLPKVSGNRAAGSQPAGRKQLWLRSFSGCWRVPPAMPECAQGSRARQMLHASASAPRLSSGRAGGLALSQPPGAEPPALPYVSPFPAALG